ncbi:MAG: hypothetical protein A3C04_01580 [Candidatus Wildermuthbacteria bacterium RIFCSPHIGHO2_02_FULL_45_25]|uniref:UMP kinase n=1 Tax=Candidatus Wildermuthbacteria bacterium RIFCSPHIGHO2_02_FULL_45_25 TaxID=1802450 RepID=A0A1G2R049_9BACT|nr:MAG: hypothetical protein A3C04_01580 [Candidatus Wildermuthbacteria bacterium RIFCSPHIGHO2_02_FULL_45_25]
MNKQFTVIGFGGSLMIPKFQEEDGINLAYLKAFRAFLKSQMKAGRKFIVVVGGGKTCRVYQKEAGKLTKPSDRMLDWIGIRATHLNASLIQTIFEKEAYPELFDRKPTVEELKKMLRENTSLYVAGGWTPGWSTDFISMNLASMFGAKEVIDAGDIRYVYDKDPKKFTDAKPIKRISWKDYRKLIPADWTPGLAAPIDPVASKFAEKAGITAKILRGDDLQNMKKAVEGKTFEGTIIM